MEAQPALAHQKLEAVTASNNTLSDQLQLVMQSVEEQCRMSVLAAHHKTFALQVDMPYPPFHSFVNACVLRFISFACSHNRSLNDSVCLTPLLLLLALNRTTYTNGRHASCSVLITCNAVGSARN